MQNKSRGAENLKLYDDYCSATIKQAQKAPTSINALSEGINQTWHSASTTYQLDIHEGLDPVDCMTSIYKSFLMENSCLRLLRTAAAWTLERDALVADPKNRSLARPDRYMEIPCFMVACMDQSSVQARIALFQDMSTRYLTPKNGGGYAPVDFDRLRDMRFSTDNCVAFRLPARLKP